MTARSAAIAATKFGLGARPGELDTVGGDGADWLIGQIESKGSAALDGPGLAASRDIFIELSQNLSDRRKAQEAKGDEAIDRSQLMALFAVYRREMEARIEKAVTTATPFVERLVHFWSNHFTVSGVNPIVANLAGVFEREAIRPHVTGRFVDMLTAVVRHPAMLIYLDNAQSVGPKSPGGRRIGRGLNENLAREVLELHTVGVDGGYGQGDVTEFAKALTGWSLGRPDGRFGGEPGRFIFRELAHEPGPRTVMGETYADGGMDQASAILDDLAHHPSTAQFVALKFARHFVSDEPPSALVDRLADTFLKSGGNLKALAIDLVKADEPWQAALAKLKTPNEFLASALRMLALDSVADRKVVESLTLLGQRPFFAPSPAGWPDRAEDWAGPDALKKRLEWSTAVAARLPAGADPATLGEAVLGPLLSPQSREAIARAESNAQGMALLLMSPEFQRR